MIPRVSPRRGAVATLRPARPDDAVIAASLLELTMGATADLFVDDTNGFTSEKLLAALFVRSGGRFSHRLGTVIEVDDAATGLLISFPAAQICALDLKTGRHLLAILGLRGGLRLARRMSSMMRIREAERGEYYISNIGVLPGFQGNGYGACLLTFAEAQARRLNLKRCSLMVDEQNEGAIRLYQRFGYKIIYSGKFNGQLTGRENGYHRMVKELT